MGRQWFIQDYIDQGFFLFFIIAPANTNIRSAIAQCTGSLSRLEQLQPIQLGDIYRIGRTKRVLKFPVRYSVHYSVQKRDGKVLQTQYIPSNFSST